MNELNGWGFCLIRTAETWARCEGLRIRGRAGDVGDGEEKRKGGGWRPGETAKEEIVVEYLVVGWIRCMHWLQILNNSLPNSLHNPSPLFCYKSGTMNLGHKQIQS